MRVEARPETSVFRMWGRLRRVYNSDDYERLLGDEKPALTSPVKTDVSIEPGGNPHRNGFHPNSVNGTGADIKSLTGEGIL